MVESLQDLNALEALRHPTRMRIVAASQKPATVEEIATELGMPVTRLYHHLDRLRAVGLIEVVGERKRGPSISSVFRATVTDIAAKGSFDDVGPVLDDARRDASASHATDIRAFGRTVAMVPRAAAERLSLMVEKAVQAFRDADEDKGELFTFTYLLAPLAGGESPIQVRPIQVDEVGLLQRVLYEAISWDPNRVLPALEVLVNHEQVARYHRAWGRPGDIGVAAELGGQVVGAAFCRLFTDEDHGHGYVDDATPELAISVSNGHRARGIGSRLLGALEDAARQGGFDRLSLSVDNGNPAARLYLRAGYTVISEDEAGIRMTKEL